MTGYAGDAQAETSTFSEAIVEASVTALAKAIASAAVAEGTCFASAQAVACSDCAGKWQQCAGSGIDGVKGCCDDTFHCVKRSKTRSVCRPKSRKIPKRWNGKILECGDTP
jgi:hypothetical protein